MKMTKFIFDLDGTITSQETLPLIASHFGVKEEIAALTKETINGNIPFIESFIKRIHILGNLPIDEVNNLLASVPLYPKLLDFLQTHKESCIIATGNLQCWVSSLVKRIGCICYGSECNIRDNQVAKLTKILKKEDVVRHYLKDSHRVVFVGDGNNDMEAMRMASVSIASGLVHRPALSVLSITDYLVYSEEALCRLLNQLL